MWEGFGHVSTSSSYFLGNPEHEFSDQMAKVEVKFCGRPHAGVCIWAVGDDVHSTNVSHVSWGQGSLLLY